MFSWLYIIVAILVRIKLGKKVIFKQIRPGKKDKNGKEKLFCMYKFRTMTDERDEHGELLPDKYRLTKFGEKLRALSLDEIPQLFNILKGDMSIVGPRPQLVSDMLFMTDEIRNRHNVRPGLTGLAQVSGRNDISWDKRLSKDLEYVEKVTFFNDLKIIFQTVIKVFKKEGINMEGVPTSIVYGKALLNDNRITQEEFDLKEAEAKRMIAEVENKKRKK